MAEGDATKYKKFKLNLMRGYFHFDTDTFKAALVSGYTPDFDNDETWADVSSYDYASGGNYTAGGKALSSLSLTLQNSTGSVLWDAADLTWNNLGPLSPVVPDYLVIYSTESEYVGSPLVESIELGSTATNGGPYKVTLPVNGLVNLE